MDLRKQIATKNDCYKANMYRSSTKGIMWHSTGANNPYLSRYVQPDDGSLGVNKNNNSWNKSGVSKCCHAFIGHLKDKKGIATYQILPWGMRGWHAGTGKNGSANASYIGFEICEDGLTDKAYAMKVYQEAVELTAYLCELYKLNPLGTDVIIDHARGHKLGIASNHGDVLHWFKKWGITLDKIRKDVKAQMDKNSKPEETGTFSDLPKSHWAYNAVEALAKDGIIGGYPNGEFRPNNTATRAEVAAMIYKVMQKK